MGKAVVTKDNFITEGVIWKGILSFFFPILLGTFFQLLYNTVDAIIVGQFLGKEALAAVGGGTGTIISLWVGFFTGLASGASVVISQKYGRGDKDKVSKAIHTSIALSILCGVLITALGILSTRASLSAIKTPDEVMAPATLYMKTYYSGIIFTVLFNMESGIFRSVGDSKHPLYYLIAGTLVNIILDIVFVGFLGMGVFGAALATVAAQALSSLLAIIKLMSGEQEFLNVKLNKIAFSSSELKATLAIGVPSGVQSVMYTISNLFIQSSINSFGTDTAAAWAAYGKLDSVFWMIVNAFGIAITTFVGQNYGAGGYERIKKGVHSTLLMASAMGLTLSALYCALARYGFMLFTRDASVIEIGVTLLHNIAPVYILYIPIEVLSGTIRGCGKSLAATLICLFGVVFIRILWLQAIVPLHRTMEMVCWCYAVSWSITSILFFIYYKKGNWLPSQNKSL